MATTTVQTGTERVNYLNVRTTVASWLLTLDHKRIGILYLLGISFFFVLGASPHR
jgi:cytochrome c oxidase subunit 1